MCLQVVIRIRAASEESSGTLVVSACIVSGLRAAILLNMAAPPLLPQCLKLLLVQARNQAFVPRTSSRLCCQARGTRQPSPLTMWQALTPASSSSIEVCNCLCCL